MYHCKMFKVNVLLSFPITTILKLNYTVSFNKLNHAVGNKPIISIMFNLVIMS